LAPSRLGEAGLRACLGRTEGVAPSRLGEAGLHATCYMLHASLHASLGRRGGLVNGWGSCGRKGGKVAFGRCVWLPCAQKTPWGASQIQNRRTGEPRGKGDRAGCAHV